MKPPSKSVADLLKALEVFPGGKGNHLHALHHLDIADKHSILMPVIRSAKVSKFMIFNPGGGPQSTWLDNTFIVSGDTGHVNIAPIPAGGYVELENDATVTPDIVLGRINPEGGYIPILPMLRKLYRETAETLSSVERKIIRK
jgi:hypothetical protein